MIVNILILILCSAISFYCGRKLSNWALSFRRTAIYSRGNRHYIRRYLKGLKGTLWTPFMRIYSDSNINETIMNGTIDYLRTKLRLVEEMNEAKWIPASEPPPIEENKKASMHVLCYGYIGGAGPSGYLRFEVARYDPCGWVTEFITPSHWMPLPVPPGGGENE